MLDDVERPAPERGLVEFGEVPEDEDAREHHAGGHRVHQPAQDRGHARVRAEEGIGHLRRQPEHDERRGDVDQQHVLQHVGREQEGLAELVQRRTDGQVGDGDARMETDRGADRVGHARGRPARPARTDGQGVEPGGTHHHEQEERLGVPVERDRHRPLSIQSGSGSQAKGENQCLARAWAPRGVPLKRVASRR